MATVLGANTLSSGGYQVDNSVRLFSNTLMTMTPSGAPTNADISTLSFWTKLAGLGTERSPIFAAGNGGGVHFRADTEQVDFYNGGGSLRTTQQFKDVSAWYHIVLRTDTTDGTANDRLRVYVNGTQVTDFAQRTNPDQNANTHLGSAVEHHIGCNTDAANFFNGYLAEVCFIDGLSLGPDSFGEFDSDSEIWKPIKVSGLTYGKNGFYLEFKSGGNLGDEDKGTQTADWSETNLTAVDQSTDTCTNNFAIINSLDNFYYASTLSEGNLKQTCNSGNYSFNTSTFGVSQGKWYVEVKTSGDDMRNAIGITDKVSTGTTDALETLPNGWSYQQGEVYNNSSVVANLGTFSSGNIVGIYLDLDNNELYFAINGSIQNSGTGLSVTASSSTTNGNYFFAFGDNASSNTDVNEVNFGSPSFAISSGNTDANGYGNFEYDPSAGTFDGASKDFYALNTKNLAEFG